jgi:ribosomal protein S18 acetylase RimI-like enzyme
LQKKKSTIYYVFGNEELLDQIAPLWTLLNEHILHLSKYFKEHYQTMTFEKRKTNLLQKSKGDKIHIDIALDKTTSQNIGYVISTLNTERTGEIDSIFVCEAYRGNGMGSSLIQKALCWMDQNGAKEKIVEVSVGNEKVWDFYERAGFLPRKTVLNAKKELALRNLS